MTLAAVNIQINTEFNSIMQKWPPYQLWQYYYPCGLALRIKIQKNILTWSMQAGLISAKNKKIPN